MIVWGGGAPVGGRYNPSTNGWVQVPAGAGSPAPRTGQTAVWTGTEMIVFGGRGIDSAQTSLNDGARYNPSNDTWTPLPSAGAPNPRYEHAAVWSGTEMIVWGGNGSGVGLGGGRYSPAANTWTATTFSNAPGLRGNLTAVWSGTEAIFWGGENAGGKLNTGGRYDPASDTWNGVNTVGAPEPRKGHTAVWTGSEMVVWGGDGPLNVLNTGGRYNPTTNSWVATSTASPNPNARRNHAAVWTGTRMIVWGGWSGSQLNSGGVYDPVGNGWVVTPGGASNPSARERHTAVWTGSEMLIWGGTGAPPATTLNTGARFSLASNSWVPISTGNFAPVARGEHTAVWTGSEMIVWGGDGATGYFNTGARYDMTTNVWTATSTGTNVPTARANHTAVWTGTQMIIWGGFNGTNTVDNGGRYAPFSDTWATMAIAGVPFRRQLHTAIWTGSLMIVWGGGDESLAPFNTGGRYDPIGNSWTPTSTTGAPSAREAHAAVFNGGDQMMIWGGADSTLFGVNTGANYFIPGNSWSTIFPSTGVPSPRFFPASAYTGSEMLIWGGGGTTDVTGGRWFQPTGQWSPISTTGAPTARERMGYVWTQDKLVVFGGRFAAGGGEPPIYNTGGRFNPATNLWSPTSVSGSVPSARFAHTAVWTGSVMIAWGGFPLTQTGGIYCPDECVSPNTYYVDFDGDGYGSSLGQVQACSLPPGYSANSSDCNDANAAIHPDAAEICNGQDMNCDGVAEGQVPPEISFGAIVRLGAYQARYPWTTIPGARYEAIRGIFSGAVGTDPFTESCLQNSTSTTFWDDLNYPAIPTFWWYLVRAENSCGKGTLGFATNHTTPTTERISLVCP
jgi:N-acetylneuraminic acid mutarotase